MPVSVGMQAKAHMERSEDNFTSRHGFSPSPRSSGDGVLAYVGHLAGAPQTYLFVLSFI